MYIELGDTHLKKLLNNVFKEKSTEETHELHVIHVQNITTVKCSLHGKTI